MDVLAEMKSDHINIKDFGEFIAECLEMRNKHPDIAQFTITRFRETNKVIVWPTKSKAIRDERRCTCQQRRRPECDAWCSRHISPVAIWEPDRADSIRMRPEPIGWRSCHGRLRRTLDSAVVFLCQQFMDTDEHHDPFMEMTQRWPHVDTLAASIGPAMRSSGRGRTSRKSFGLMRVSHD